MGNEHIDTNIHEYWDFSPRGLGQSIPNLPQNESEHIHTNIWNFSPTIVGQSDQNSENRCFQERLAYGSTVILGKKTVLSFLSKSDSNWDHSDEQHSPNSGKSVPRTKLGIVKDSPVKGESNGVYTEFSQKAPANKIRNR